MKDMFKPVRPRRLADEAREQIEELVRSGKIEAGAKLPPERELMALLSVSRTSLREAIRALESVGMLRVVPGRGTFVTERSAASLAQDWYTWLLGHKQEVVQILEVHEALEVKVAELAAERIDDSGVAELGRYLRAMSEAVDRKDHGALVAADAGFHRAIREAGGNVIIARILNDLEDHVLDARRAIMSLPSRVQRVVSDHSAIFDGIAASDGEAAALATLLHVRRSKEEIVGSGLLTLRTPGAATAHGRGDTDTAGGRHRARARAGSAAQGD